MDWLQSLLWDPSSVAHIVLLYAFVVAAGVYLGKIKIFGVSLGVTFVLFAGILMGHFGFTADTHIPVSYTHLDVYKRQAMYGNPDRLLSDSRD